MKPLESAPGSSANSYSPLRRCQVRCTPPLTIPCLDQTRHRRDMGYYQGFL